MQTISRVGGVITKAAACQAARQEFARQFQTMAASMDYWHLYACRGGLVIAQMDQGVIVRSSAQAMAHLLNGSLIEAAIWIAEEGASDERLDEALQALELMLAGWRAA